MGKYSIAALVLALNTSHVSGSIVYALIVGAVVIYIGYINTVVNPRYEAEYKAQDEVERMSSMSTDDW